MNSNKPNIAASVINDFAEAVKQKNVRAINTLLCEQGEYETQIKNLTIRKSNKKSFMRWFEKKLLEKDVLHVDFDTCSQCYVGNTVLLFNNGEFPVVPKDGSYRVKTGLMLRTKEDKIVQIKFCFSFSNTTNPFVFEQRIKTHTNHEAEPPF